MEERGPEEHAFGSNGPSYISSDRSHLESHRILESRLIKTAEDYQRSQLIKNGNYAHGNNKISSNHMNSSSTFNAHLSVSKATL